MPVKPGSVPYVGLPPGASFPSFLPNTHRLNDRGQQVHQVLADQVGPTAFGDGDTWAPQAGMPVIASEQPVAPAYQHAMTGMTAVRLKRNENGGVGLTFCRKGLGPFTIVAMPEAVRLFLKCASLSRSI